jgi:DMSO/TMAO reductase YedYZ heme-binding membrane subunit
MVLWFVARGTGIVLVGQITLVTATGVLSFVRTRSTHWSPFAAKRLHRDLSVFSIVLLLVHVTASVLHRYGKIQIGLFDVLIPFSGIWEPFWVGLGSIAFDIMLVVSITSHARNRLRLSPGRWQMIHVLSYAAWTVGLAHGLGIGTDATTTWGLGVAALSVTIFAGCLNLRMRTSKVSTEQPRDRNALVYRRTRP